MIDHKELIDKRLATQYTNAPYIRAFLDSILTLSNDLETAVDEIINLRWIDVATGVQLDILGDIVGQKREVLNIDQFEFFGFSGALGAGTFSDLDNPSLGSRFHSIDEPTTGNVILSDPEYRVFIRARIIKNFTDGTVEDVTEAVELIFDVDSAWVQQLGTAAAKISIGKLLTNSQKLLIQNSDIIVRPAGVSYTYIEYEDTPFAFSGVQDADGFSSLSDPLSGGKFSSLI